MLGTFFQVTLQDFYFTRGGHGCGGKQAPRGKIAPSGKMFQVDVIQFHDNGKATRTTGSVVRNHTFETVMQTKTIEEAIQLTVLANQTKQAPNDQDTVFYSLAHKELNYRVDQNTIVIDEFKQRDSRWVHQTFTLHPEREVLEYWESRHWEEQPRSWTKHFYKYHPEGASTFVEKNTSPYALATFYRQGDVDLYREAADYKENE